MIDTRQANLEQRAKLVARGCTLNGETAYIVGIFSAFATVRQRDSGLEAQWSWEAVQRVFDKNGGAFRS